MFDFDPQQESAIQRALTLDAFAFFFEPRVGKTDSALEVVNRRPNVDLLIIIIPLSAENVWKEALERRLKHTCEVMLLNFEKFNSKSTRRKLRRLAEARTSMIIVDEAHRLKNRMSKQSRGIRTLRDRSRYRLALTGTSIEKEIHNTWAIFDFLDPTIFGKFAEFREEFLVMGGYMGYKIIGHKNEEEFLRRFHAHSARIRLTEVSDRPIKVRRQIISLIMGYRGAELYNELEERLIVETNKVRVETPLAITLALRLQQLTGGYLCSGENIEQVDTTKLDWVKKSIDSYLPAVIVCRYRHEIDVLQARLKAYSTLIVRGGEPLLSARPNVDIVLIQTSSGLGIDLSQAKTTIFYSWDYSFINYEQIRFRTLSRKQTTAHYVFLIIRNSIDEVIYEVAVGKKKLSKAINDHYRS